MHPRYRDASNKIFELILKHCEIVEKASIDEAYLDLTLTVNKRLKELDASVQMSNLLINTHVVGSYNLEACEGYISVDLTQK